MRCCGGSILGRYRRRYEMRFVQHPPVGLLVLTCLVLFLLLFAGAILLLITRSGSIQDVVLVLGYGVFLAAAALLVKVSIERFSAKQNLRGIEALIVLGPLGFLASIWSDATLVGTFYLAGELSSLFG
jgi:hypothetical protein